MVKEFNYDGKLYVDLTTTEETDLGSYIPIEYPDSDNELSIRMSSGDDHFINHRILLVILSDSNTDPSEHSDSSTDSRRQSIPVPPPPVMPATRDYPRGRGCTRATARKTIGLPSRRHLLPGEGTSNAAQLHGLLDIMRHQLQANFMPRGEVERFGGRSAHQRCRGGFHEGGTSKEQAFGGDGNGDNLAGDGDNGGGHVFPNGMID
ncbi:hypothetical protein E3N88_07106 [Mikania micrantha]|uniref:Uncharacterized protein n=1 Tax=Mikania micrantha TaxID=192012 RepID=A0A5N6PT05_9ASTR|nr:hypothetical protein E3N88_07106 [Mikania micrantha]